MLRKRLIILHILCFHKGEKQWKSERSTSSLSVSSLTLPRTGGMACLLASQTAGIQCPALSPSRLIFFRTSLSTGHFPLVSLLVVSLTTVKETLGCSAFMQDCSEIDVDWCEIKCLYQVHLKPRSPFSLAIDLLLFMCLKPISISQWVANLGAKEKILKPSTLLP